MGKRFNNTEKQICQIFKTENHFEYNGKKYKILNAGKPTSKKGEPKTDIYVEAEELISKNIMELKISFKQKNYEFLENKMSYERAIQIFGEKWKEIISKSILKIKSKFEEKSLIYKEKLGKTEKGAITLGWKFELLTVASGNLSDKIELTNNQLIDVYSGINLEDSKKNSMVNGNIIPMSGIANCILIEGNYNLDIQSIVNNLISIEEFVDIHPNIYFACKALNYRTFKKKYDGDRPLAVYVNWKIENKKLNGKLIFDEPLLHKGNEIATALLSCLKELNIYTTEDININNTNINILYNVN